MSSDQGNVGGREVCPRRTWSLNTHAIVPSLAVCPAHAGLDVMPMVALGATVCRASSALNDYEEEPNSTDAC